MPTRTCTASALVIARHNKDTTAHLSDVLVGGTHFSNSDAHGGGQGVPDQAVHLLRHGGAEQQGLTGGAHLPNDAAHLQPAHW